MRRALTRASIKQLKLRFARWIGGGAQTSLRSLRKGDYYARQMTTHPSGASQVSDIQLSNSSLLSSSGLSSSGSTGRSSISSDGPTEPRKPLLTGSPAGACHRAALCADPVAGDDGLSVLRGRGCPHSRGAIRPSFASSSALLKSRGRRESRVPIAPVAPVQQEAREVGPQVQPDSRRLSLRGGLRPYFAPLPGDRALLPPSSAGYFPQT